MDTAKVDLVGTKLNIHKSNSFAKLSFYALAVSPIGVPAFKKVFAEVCGTETVSVNDTSYRISEVLYKNSPTLQIQLPLNFTSSNSRCPIVSHSVFSQSGSLYPGNMVQVSSSGLVTVNTNQAANLTKLFISGVTQFGNKYSFVPVEVTVIDCL